MKKLLSLLSVLTISGTSIPEVTAVSSYQKQETIKNNEINYSQTNNNVKNLKRNKREIKEKVHFYGYEDWGNYGTNLRGGIQLDTTNKKIKFFSRNNNMFHQYFDGHKGTIYTKITIKNQNQNIIKYIEIHSKDRMQNVIEKYNLQNGIDYQNGYIIEIYSKEGWMTWFNINNENNWKKINGRDNIDWDKNWKFRINNNEIIPYYEYNKKIEFLGWGDKYKGEIGFDITNKKIKFFGNNEEFNSLLNGNKKSALIYNKIIIKNQNNQEIKNIIIYGTDSMEQIINKYNLQNEIDYQNGYIIEIFSAEPCRLIFFENKNEKYVTKDRTKWNWQKRFKIINNNITDYKYSLDELIKTNNLEKFDDNKAILNELNYLNPELDISQLKVNEKDNNSVIIKAKSNSDLYFGENKIFFKINNEKIKIIDLNNLIKKGIYLNLRDVYPWIIWNDIRNINIDNLEYENVIATRDIQPLYNNKNNKDICFIKNELENITLTEQTFKTPSCKYIEETTINKQITTGFSKEETNSNTSDKKHHWNFKLDVNVHGDAGVWPFGKVSTDINTGFETGGEYGISETKTLSTKFEFSNSETNEFKKISEVELPSQEIILKPNEMIKVTASLVEVLAKVILNLKQDIYGKIIAEKQTVNKEKYLFNFSIKELMQKLNEYHLLPKEITINNNNTITFNGKANISAKKTLDGNIKFNKINK